MSTPPLCSPFAAVSSMSLGTSMLLKIQKNSSGFLRISSSGSLPQFTVFLRQKKATPKILRSNSSVPASI